MKKNTQYIAVSIFLTAFVFGLNITGISPVLGILGEKYSDYGTSMIQLLQTIPYLLLMIGSLLVGWLTTKISKKKIIIIGMFIIGVSGALPILIDSFVVLLITRIIIGFGFGIIGPMNTAVVSEFFEPQERAFYMGLHVVGMGVGTMLGNLLGGYLSGIQYEYFYIIYLVAFVGILGTKICLVETPPVQAKESKNMKMNKMVYAISFVSLIHTLFINVYSTNIGMYIAKDLGEDSTMTGIATAMNAGAALLIGIFFSKVLKVLKSYALSVSILFAAIGYGGILIVHGIVGVYITSICCGISLSCFMATASYLISVSVSKDAVAKASGIFSIIGGIGGLIAPIILGNTCNNLFGDNTPVNQFILALIGMLICGVLVLVITISKRREEGIVK